MITKYKIYNESVKSLLVGPTIEDAWKSFGFDSFDDPEKFFSYLIDPNGRSLTFTNKGVPFNIYPFDS